MNSKSFIRYALSFGTLIFLLMQMNWTALLNTVAVSSIWTFICAIALVMAQIYLLNLRWHAYLSAGRKPIAFKTSVLINIAGYFANVVFITSVGGIIAKSGLAIRHGIPVVHSVFATFLDRFMTLAALLFFSAISLPFLQNIIDDKVAITLAFCITFLTLGIVLFILLLRSGILNNYILSDRRRSRIVSTLRNFTENYDLMSRTAVQSIVAQFFFFLSVYVLSLGLNHPHEANVIEFLALLPVLSLISSLPISVGGWGLREGAFIYGLGLIGFSMEDAFLLSVQVGLVGLIAPFIFGLPYIMREDFKEFFVKPKTEPAYEKAKR